MARQECRLMAPDRAERGSQAMDKGWMVLRGAGRAVRHAGAIRTLFSVQETNQKNKFLQHLDIIVF